MRSLLYTAFVNVVVLDVALLISEHVVIPTAPITATSRDPEAQDFSVQHYG